MNQDWRTGAPQDPGKLWVAVTDLGIWLLFIHKREWNLVIKEDGEIQSMLQLNPYQSKRASVCCYIYCSTCSTMPCKCAVSQAGVIWSSLLLVLMQQEIMVIAHILMPQQINLFSDMILGRYCSRKEWQWKKPRQKLTELFKRKMQQCFQKGRAEGTSTVKRSSLWTVHQYM